MKVSASPTFTPIAAKLNLLLGLSNGTTFADVSVCSVFSSVAYSFSSVVTLSTFAGITYSVGSFVRSFARSSNTSI